MIRTKHFFYRREPAFAKATAGTEGDQPSLKLWLARKGDNAEGMTLDRYLPSSRLPGYFTVL